MALLSFRSFAAKGRRKKGAYNLFQLISTSWRRKRTERIEAYKGGRKKRKRRTK